MTLKITVHGKQQADGSYVFFNNITDKQVITSTATGVTCARNQFWTLDGSKPDYIKFSSVTGTITFESGAGIAVNETISMDIGFDIQTCFGGSDAVSKKITIQVTEHPDPDPTPTPTPPPEPTTTPNPTPDPTPDPTNYPSVDQLVSLDGDVSIASGPNGGAEITDSELIRHVSAAWADPRTASQFNRITVDISNDVAHSMPVVHEPDKAAGSLGTRQSTQYEVVSTLPDYLTFDDFNGSDTGTLSYLGKEGTLVNDGDVEDVIVRYRVLYDADEGAVQTTVFGTLTLQVAFVDGTLSTPAPSDDEIGIDTWWVILLIVLGVLGAAAGAWLYFRKSS